MTEPERYELSEEPRYEFGLGRRGFFGMAGAGLLISVAPAQTREANVGARVHVDPDGRFTVLTGKVEVGQGSRTQITQAAAEELRVPVERITLVMADTTLAPDDGGTAGSGTTPRTVPAVRRACAAAREILDALAGEKSADLEKALDKVVPPGVTVTPVERWKVLGTAVARPNGRDIVTGAHRFPSDIERPNMLYGKVLRPPSFGAELKDAEMPKLDGAVLVREGNFVGSAAATSWAAQQALAAVRATWTEKPQVSSRNLFAHLKKTASSERARVTTRGSVEAAMGAARVVEASYEVSYIQHAPMEPRAAVAEWAGGKLTVWTGTQQPMRVRGELARAFKIPDEHVRVIVPDAGGGFGGKHTGEAAVEAARLAKAAGRPVSLRWTREEEFTWAYFRPAGLIEARAGVDASGRLVAWEFTNHNSGGSALETPYDVAHARHRFLFCDSPLREGSYRVLAATANNFARESFMDELAAAAKADPLEYRMAHLKNDRLRAVLQAAADRFGWRGRKKNTGIACGTEKGSYVAACVEVAVNQGQIRVLRVCQAFECGAIQNPANLRAQADGCVIMTLGGTLTEEIRFESGRILNGRFSEYRVPRFRDVPPIETVLVDRRDLPSAGAGETPMIAVPPAVAGAVFEATGR
ncbi:MAG: molybdopterin cofactor-binding domain-containing protein, partial [Bryobacteraceae bacterium]